MECGGSREVHLHANSSLRYLRCGALCLVSQLGGTAFVIAISRVILPLICCCAVCRLCLRLVPKSIHFYGCKSAVFYLGKSQLCLILCFRGQ